VKACGKGLSTILLIFNHFQPLFSKKRTRPGSAASAKSCPSVRHGFLTQEINVFLGYMKTLLAKNDVLSDSSKFSTQQVLGQIAPWP
jgi:hypothetical protein